MSNKTELLQKIKALADRGVEGERESSASHSTRLMEQYGSARRSLKRIAAKRHGSLIVQEIERRLLAQIIYMVTGASSYGCVGTYTGTQAKEAGRGMHRRGANGDRSKL